MYYFANGEKNMLYFVCTAVKLYDRHSIKIKYDEHFSFSHTHTLCLWIYCSLVLLFFFVYEAKEKKTTQLRNMFFSLWIAWHFEFIVRKFNTLFCTCHFLKREKKESQKSFSNERMDKFDFDFDLTLWFVWHTTDSCLTLPVSRSSSLQTHSQQKGKNNL